MSFTDASGELSFKQFGATSDGLIWMLYNLYNLDNFKKNKRTIKLYITKLCNTVDFNLAYGL